MERKEWVEVLKKEADKVNRGYPNERLFIALSSAIAEAELMEKVASRSNGFEEFLTEKHAEQFIGTKDCMIDDYEKWLSDLGIDDWVKLGEQFRKSITAQLNSEARR